MAKEKVVLAYSGGLDTSIIISWLIENYDYEVIAVCGDVGQGKETEGLEEKALKTGASKLYIENLQEEYVKDFIWPTLKAGAVYEGKYLLGTSHARPVIAKALVDKPEEVSVKQTEGRQEIVIELKVAPEDMGKVIGRQGRIAKEIRTIVKSVAQRDGKKVSVEIVD